MQRLIDNAMQIGIRLDDGMVEQFRVYERLLLDWNQRMNLTAITDHDAVLDKHFLDSLYILSLLDIPQNSRIIDVGTGAGFPGIPLRIARPDLQLVLLDGTRKRVNFLSAVSEALGQGNNTCLHGRAEETAHVGEYREVFDFAAARAVASLPVLCELCLPYVRVDGSFLALKGPGAVEEIAAAKHSMEELGARVSRCMSYRLPDGDERNLIIIKKISHTPTKYPRSYGKIKKSPL